MGIMNSLLSMTAHLIEILFKVKFMTMHQPQIWQREECGLFYLQSMSSLDLLDHALVRDEGQGMKMNGVGPTPSLGLEDVKSSVLIGKSHHFF